MTREALILHYMPYVRTLAVRMMMNLPRSVELDDLVSEGTIGLIQNVDANVGDFVNKKFLKFRINGQMRDYLRRLDFMPRDTRTALTAKTNAETPEQSLKYDIQDGPAVLSIEDPHLDFALLAQNGKARQYSKSFTHSNQETHMAACEDCDRIERLAANLTRGERYAVLQYFQSDRALLDISKSLHVNESRASQLKNQALAKMRVV